MLARDVEEIELRGELYTFKIVVNQYTLTINKPQKNS